MVHFWVGGYFCVLFFSYIKSSCSLFFVTFLMDKGDEKLIKKRGKEERKFEEPWDVH